MIEEPVHGAGDVNENISENRGINMSDGNSMDRRREMNTILKGSKLIGDIIISGDIEISGDVEGNITSQQDSNITIKGSCKGNIETKGGNVDIEGEFLSGNISTGGNVSINGKFKGGEIKAKGKIYVNNEFRGKLEANEIEIGAESNGSGELFYRELIAVARGAKVKVQINSLQDDSAEDRVDTDVNVVNMKPVKEVAQGQQ